MVDQVLRWSLTAFHQALKMWWRVRRPNTFGSHALALTPNRRLILVKLRYAPGWRPPGGGRSQDEDPVGAALRELKEEIGMISHGQVKLACELEQHLDSKHDLASVVVVREVKYQPRWSLEVEQVREFDIGNLPSDIAPVAKAWIDAVLPKL